jgi:ribonuclease HII
LNNLALLDFYSKNLVEAGCDEAGRGCLAGPVFAAAVILPKSFNHPLLNDSKKVSALNREKLRIIIEQEAVSFSVSLCTHDEIDKINILNASILAMHNALGTMEQKPEFIIVDGNRFKPFLDIPYSCIIKGDSKYKSIAAASILAKTYRDEFMQQLHDEFPHYNWKINKGYPTLEHRKAIEKYGLCKYHRKTFNKNFYQYQLFYKQLNSND